MDIEQMALEAGFGETLRKGFWVSTKADRARFANLVRNAVLEEAAVKCEALSVPPACNGLEHILWGIATTQAGDAIRSMKKE